MVDYVIKNHLQKYEYSFNLLERYLINKEDAVRSLASIQKLTKEVIAASNQ